MPYEKVHRHPRQHKMKNNPKSLAINQRKTKRCQIKPKKGKRKGDGFNQIRCSGVYLVQPTEMKIKKGG